MLAVRIPSIWVLAASYFLMNFALGAQPWFPLLLGQFNLSATQVSLAVAIPNLLAACAMVFWGKRSDRTGERLNHLLVASMVSAVGWMLCGYASGSVGVAFAGIALALVGLFASLVVFWTIPAGVMAAEARPAGIGLVTCVGLIGSFLSSTIPEEPFRELRRRHVLGRGGHSDCSGPGEVLRRQTLAGGQTGRCGRGIAVIPAE
jgi:MFS family permease